MIDPSILEEKISCTVEGCTKTMYLKDGQYGPYYSHKEESAPKGYHTVNADKVEVADRTRSSLNHTEKAGYTVQGEYNRLDRPEVARGKTKCAVATAFIAAGQTKFTSSVKADAILWVDWIMDEGKKVEETAEEAEEISF